MKPYIASDLDGTLAVIESGKFDPTEIGKPVMPMVRLLQDYLKKGFDVKIFTARYADEKNREAVVKAIEDWTEKHIGKRLEVTNTKDEQMLKLYDDKAVSVRRNTGDALDANPLTYFFSYGTLKNPHIQNMLGGIMDPDQDDTLKGFRETTVEIKGKKWSNIVVDPKSSVKGKLYAVEPDQWKRILDWEDDYKHIKMTLESGERAYVFIAKGTEKDTTMGSQAMKITGDVEKTVKLLNQAFASEWLAYYQYYVGAKVIEGPFKDTIGAELATHASEELGHANLLADRIIILGGTPILNPKDWPEMSPCPFDAPEDPYVLELVRQNLKGERCAIVAYNKIMESVKDTDSVTFEMVVEILADEEQHEEDLQRFEEDLKLLATRATTFK